MLPLVCNEAAAFLFMFDLTRLNTLNSLKEWYRQARGFNKVHINIIIGLFFKHVRSGSLFEQISNPWLLRYILYLARHYRY